MELLERERRQLMRDVGPHMRGGTATLTALNLLSPQSACYPTERATTPSRPSTTPLLLCSRTRAASPSTTEHDIAQSREWTLGGSRLAPPPRGSRTGGSPPPSAIGTARQLLLATVTTSPLNSRPPTAITYETICCPRAATPLPMTMVSHTAAECGVSRPRSRLRSRPPEAMSVGVGTCRLGADKATAVEASVVQRELNRWECNVLSRTVAAAQVTVAKRDRSRELEGVAGDWFSKRVHADEQRQRAAADKAARKQLQREDLQFKHGQVRTGLHGQACARSKIREWRAQYCDKAMRRVELDKHVIFSMFDPDPLEALTHSAAAVTPKAALCERSGRGAPELQLDELDMEASLELPPAVLRASAAAATEKISPKSGKSTETEHHQRRLHVVAKRELVRAMRHRQDNDEAVQQRQDEQMHAALADAVLQTKRALKEATETVQQVRWDYATDARERASVERERWSALRRFRYGESNRTSPSKKSEMNPAASSPSVTTQISR